MQNSLFENPGATPVVALQFPEWSVGGEVEEAVAALDEPAAEVQITASQVSEEDLQALLQQAREQAAEQTRAAVEQHFQSMLDTERTAIALACASFAKTREKYFASIEADVVKLALGIAARVLQREAAMDPLLLRGVVRVALSKLNDADAAVLYTSEEESNIWQRGMKNSGLRVEGDASLARGELQLRTTAGVAELGIEAQLQEIERGFFDLLAKRPA